MARFSNVPETFRARKVISKTTKPLMYRAFYVNRFCIEPNLILMRCFESKYRFVFFSYGLLKLAFRVRKLSGAFEKREPAVCVARSRYCLMPPYMKVSSWFAQTPEWLYHDRLYRQGYLAERRTLNPHPRSAFVQIPLPCSTYNNELQQ